MHFTFPVQVQSLPHRRAGLVVRAEGSGLQPWQVAKLQQAAGQGRRQIKVGAVVFAGIYFHFSLRLDTWSWQRSLSPGQQQLL